MTVKEFLNDFDKCLQDANAGVPIEIVEQGRAVARLISMFRAEHSKHLVWIENGQEIKAGKTIEVSAEEFKQNLNRYLVEAESHNEIVIVKNGEQMARFVGMDLPYITSTLMGVLNTNYTDEEIQDIIGEALEKKYESYN